jgi:hypothetical protein
VSETWRFHIGATSSEMKIFIVLKRMRILALANCNYWGSPILSLPTHSQLQQEFGVVGSFFPPLGCNTKGKGDHQQSEMKLGNAVWDRNTRICHLPLARKLSRENQQSRLEFGFTALVLMTSVLAIRIEICNGEKTGLESWTVRL